MAIFLSIERSQLWCLSWKLCADHIRPSVCPSVTQYQKLIHLSYFHEIWYSISVLKGNQACESLMKIDSMLAVLYRKNLMNSNLHIPYFLIDLCELGTENLHIMRLRKYQINQNQSSWSHTVVQGVNGKIKYFSKFPLRSEHNPVQNMLVTICWVTVSFKKIGSLKDIFF